MGQVRILDAKTMADLLPRPGHAGIVLGLSLPRDGSVLTAGLDRSVRRWDLESGRETNNQPIDLLRTWVTHSSFTSDGRGLFGREAGDIVYVDLASGSKRKVTTEKINPVSIIHGVAGTSVFVNTTERKVQQWDAELGKVVQTFDPPPANQGSPSSPTHVTMSPDRRTVVILSTGTAMSGQFGYFTSSQISLYDAKTAELRRRWQTQDARFDIAVFSPDGTHVLVGGVPMSGAVPAESPDGALPISAKSGLVLLEAHGGDPVRTFEPGVKLARDFHRVRALAFSANGNLFAAAQLDGSICIYELGTGSICRTYRGHRHDVSHMAFTTDGRRLVSVSRDMTGLVWDTSFASLSKSRPLTSAADRERAWVDLVKPEWELAGPALASLSEKPDDLLALVRDHLKPAEKPDFDAEALPKLVEQLGDQLFAVRERASAGLSRMGREALPALREHLGRVASAEQRRRLQQAIEQIARSPVPSEHLRQIRVLALLEQLGTPAARAELKRLAGGNADAALTRDALAASHRVKN